MVRVKVKVVGLDQHTMNPVVVITDTEETGFIPILIGAAEARAIRVGLEGRKMERPMTHDLLKNTLDAMQAKVEKVVITDLQDQTYYAQVHVRTRDGVREIDARPSDAIALALRTDAAIYISEKVARKAMEAPKPQPDEEMAAFRRFLRDLTPEDFRKFAQGNDASDGRGAAPSEGDGGSDWRQGSS